MLVGRCSSELSPHDIQAKSKKSQPLSVAPLQIHRDDTALGDAESKDPQAARLARSVQYPSQHRSPYLADRHGFPRGRRSKIKE